MGHERHIAAVRASDRRVGRDTMSRGHVDRSAESRTFLVCPMNDAIATSFLNACDIEKKLPRCG
jgi:hypothetical protein